MNERIRELAKQAGFYFYDMHDVDGQDFGETIEADNWSAADKFVELIVNESIEVMMKHDYHGEWLGEKLKDHFGVK